MAFRVIFNSVNPAWEINEQTPVWIIVRWTLWRAQVVEQYGYNTYIVLLYVQAAAVLVAVLGLVWLTLAMRRAEQSKWLRHAAMALHVLFDVMFQVRTSTVRVLPQQRGLGSVLVPVVRLLAGDWLRYWLVQGAAAWVPGGVSGLLHVSRGLPHVRWRTCVGAAACTRSRAAAHRTARANDLASLSCTRIAVPAYRIGTSARWWIFGRACETLQLWACRRGGRACLLTTHS